MKFILNYLQYLSENNKGISPNVIELSDLIFSNIKPLLISNDYLETKNILLTHRCKNTTKHNNKDLIFNVKDLNISILIKNGLENKCDSVVDFSNSIIEDDYIKDVRLTFSIVVKEFNEQFIEYISSVVLHETLHIYQIFNIKKYGKSKPESWSIFPLISQFRRLMKSKYVHYILDLLYFSLNHELYAQLHQYYHYKTKNLKYERIFKIIEELENFEIKELDNIENVEIDNIKKFILKSIKNDFRSKKYLNDINKSLWNISDNKQFLIELKDLFSKKSDILKNKIKKIDSKFNIDSIIEESSFITLPSGYVFNGYETFELNSILSDLKQINFI